MHMGSQYFRIRTSDAIGIMIFSHPEPPSTQVLINLVQLHRSLQRLNSRIQIGQTHLVSF